MTAEPAPASLMTAAPILSEPPEWIPTGNLRVSVPAISRRDAGIYRVGVLRADTNCLLDLVGDEPGRRPLLVPLLEQAGRRLELKELRWSRQEYWLPHFTARLSPHLHVQGTIFAAAEENGLVYELEISNDQAKAVEISVGVEGVWAGLETVVFSSRPAACVAPLWQDPWTGSLVGEASNGLPLLAWALQSSVGGEWRINGNAYRWQQDRRIPPGSSLRLAFYMAVNLERDGARTSALHLRRVGADHWLAQTTAWLKAHRRPCADAGAERLLNENLFFNYFYSQGICLDSEQEVLVTSRSNQYYVCAAFWARDAFLWSLPALTLVDAAQARQVLLAGLSRYRQHGAEHALYLNGRPLYPGFELDEACAPLIGIASYAHLSGDATIYVEAAALAAVAQWERDLEGHFDAELGLYDTFLTPQDDPTAFPFLTYDNVLVWKACLVAAKILRRESSRQSERYVAQAAALQQSILERCVQMGSQGRQFVGAVDRHGQPQWVDFPGGSLTLLPSYGFCSPQQPEYCNTLKWIYSEANPYYYHDCRFPGVGSVHFPAPSSFDLANRLICGEPAALQEALQAQMDQGLACESFDPTSGRVLTGAAFATGAGFFAQGIDHYFSASRRDVSL